MTLPKPRLDPRTGPMKDGRIRLHDGRTWTPTPAAYAWLRKLRDHGPQKAWPPGIATGSNTMDAGWTEFVINMPDGRNVRASDATREELDGTPPDRWWTHLTEAGRAALQMSEPYPSQDEINEWNGISTARRRAEPVVGHHADVLEALKAIWEEVQIYAEETGREVVSLDTANQVRAAITKASPEPRDAGRPVPKHGSGP